MKEGTAELFGPRNEVIGQLTRLASVKSCERRLTRARRPDHAQNFTGLDSERDAAQDRARAAGNAVDQALDRQPAGRGSASAR
jgi:hypothetical protein